MCYAGALQADSNGSIAPSPLYYSFQATPLHGVSQERHPGALDSPEQQAGLPSFSMPVVSPFPPLGDDEELLDAEATATSLGFGQAEALRHPAFTAFHSVDVSPLGPPSFPGEGAPSDWPWHLRPTA